MRPRFTVFDRWGNQIGVVQNVVEAVHKDELNGEDSLTLVLPSCDLAKGQRIVWRDEWLEWHEHTVCDFDTVHGDGAMLSTVYCENSVSELLTDFIEELRPYGTTAQEALGKALSESRWKVGRVDDFGVSSASFYHESAFSCVSKIVEAWGCELSTTISVEGAAVAERSVNLLRRRGADNGKRFEWRKDIESIKRTVSADDVCTALYGYGKGLEKEDDEGEWTGGYERKLTFGEINGGLDYVADEAAKDRWGVPDGNGGVKHAFGIAEFPECEDMAELKRLTEADLAERNHPHVSYEANVLALADAGFAHEATRTGDSVDMVDGEMGERLRGRVLCVERHLFAEQATKITLGNLSRTINGVIASQAADLNALKSRASAWDGAAAVSDSYINRVIGNLNAAMNATGGYVYMEPGEGITTYDKPADGNPTMATQIKGAGVRIANAKKSNGEWDWRTLLLGSGIVADCITAGAINGGSVRWNLESGQLDNIHVMSETATEQRIVLVRMDAANALGVYTGTRSRTVASDGTVSLGDPRNLERRGGVYMDGDEVAFCADYLATNPEDIGSDTGTRVRFGTPNPNLNGGFGSSKKGLNLGTRLSESVVIIGDTIYLKDGLSIKDGFGNEISMRNNGIRMSRGNTFFNLNCNDGVITGMQFSASNGTMMHIGNVGSLGGISIVSGEGSLMISSAGGIDLETKAGSRLRLAYGNELKDGLLHDLQWNGKTIS